MKTNMKPHQCVQCGKDMLNQYGNGDWSAPFCESPECPNYGLLQTGIFNKKDCPYRVPDCPKDTMQTPTTTPFSSDGNKEPKIIYINDLLEVYRIQLRKNGFVEQTAHEAMEVLRPIMIHYERNLEQLE